MKVAHINLSDNSGGAANAVVMLHKAMTLKGIESTIYVVRSAKKSEEYVVKPKVVEAELTWKARYVITRYLSKGGDKKRGLFSADFGSSSVVNAKNFRNYDAIYIHWINHGMMSVSALEKILKLNKPVFWVCHDMWPITGGCHYSLECKNYKSHCGACPSLNSVSMMDYSYKLFERKYKVYKKYPNLNFISISQFTDDFLNSAKLSQGHNIYQITNAIDLDIFKPRDKSFCRDLFSLPQEKKLILFGADGGVGNPYKGWKYAKKAIIKLHEKYGEDIELVVFGSLYNKEIEEQLLMKINFVGIILDKRAIAALYSSCDVFLNPSIAETLSYTAVESIACGTRCVAFRVGGIVTSVLHMETGYLVGLRDVNGLVEGVEWCLKECDMDSTFKNCHADIKKRFDLNVIGQKHLELLKNTINCEM